MRPRIQYHCSVLLWGAVLLIGGGCAAPYTMTKSGKVTPAGEWRVATHFNGAVSTQTTKSLFEGFQASAEAAVRTASDEGEVTYDAELRKLNEGLIAYALEPVGTGMELGVRYGMIPRLDGGYKYASGTHVLDARYQFMGEVNQGGGSGSFGSIGLQFSRKSYELPSTAGLDKLQTLFGFEATRMDVLIPLNFSHSFGGETELGSFGYGAVLAYANIDYGFEPDSPFTAVAEGTVDPEPLEQVGTSKSVLGYGAFCNVRFGYDFIFAVASLAMYYQDYGTFTLMDDTEVAFSGLTFVPSLGIEGSF